MAEGDLKNREFIGRGLQFPIRVNSYGSLALTRGLSEIDESIRIILETAPGERVMRPEFGCRIWELLFEPRNVATEAAAVEYVEEALRLWEPRIDVVSVILLDDPNHDESVMLVEVVYRIKRTHDERSIVFPFYVMDEPTE